MDVRPGSVNELKKGSSIMVDGVACKVTNITKSKPGKHGHAKARIEAVGLIDDKKRVIIKPTDSRIDIPVIDKRSAQVLSISDGKANVMDTESYGTFDLDIPSELKEKVVEGVTVLYWDVVGIKVMKSVK
jgi:translation initiation factor 5A